MGPGGRSVLLLSLLGAGVSSSALRRSDGESALGVDTDLSSVPASPSSALAVSTTFSTCEELSKGGHQCDVGNFDASLSTFIVEESKFASGCCRCGAHHYVKKGKCVECDVGFWNRAGDDPSGADTKCTFSAHRMRQEWTKDTYPVWDKRFRPPDEYLMKPVGHLSQLQDNNPDQTSQADQLKKEIAYWRANFGAEVSQDRDAVHKVAPLRAEEAKLESMMDAWNSIQTDPVENKSVTVIRLVTPNRTALADELTPYFLPAIPTGVAGGITSHQVEVMRNRTALVLATDAALGGEDDAAALDASRALVESDAVIHGEKEITENEDGPDVETQSNIKLFTPQVDVLCKEYQRMKSIQNSIVEEFKAIRKNETRLFDVFEVDATEAEHIARESTDAAIEQAVAVQLRDSCRAREKGEIWTLSEEKFEEDVENGTANSAQQEVDFLGPNQFKNAASFKRANDAKAALASAKSALDKTESEEEQTEADIALLNQTCSNLSLAADARQATSRTLTERENELYGQQRDEKSQLDEAQTDLLRAAMKLWRTHTKMEEIELVLTNMHAQKNCEMGALDDDWSALFEGEDDVIPPQGGMDQMLDNFAKQTQNRRV